MAGMTDTAFRRLVKRQGGCGLVVTEMVSSEGLVRGIDRTLDTPIHRRRAAGLDSDLRRRPRTNGGGRARRRRHGRRHRRRQHGLPGAEDRQAQRRVQLDAGAGARGHRHRVDGESGQHSGHRQDAQRLGRRRAERSRTWPGGSQDAGASAIAIHGRTAKQSYTGTADWDIVAASPTRSRFRCSAPAIVSSRSRLSIDCGRE